MLQGDAPVRATERLADEPLQMVTEPEPPETEIAAVGFEFTVTTSEPVPALEQLFPSDTLVIV